MRIDSPTENWTKFPNCILDNLPAFSPPALKVICWMVRQTLGWNSGTRQDFALSFIQTNTGLSRPCIVKAVEELLGMDAIIKLDSGPRGICRYAVNWSTGKNGLPEEDSTGKNGLPVLVNQVNTEKDSSKRQENEKERASAEPALPLDIPAPDSGGEKPITGRVISDLWIRLFSDLNEGREPLADEKRSGSIILNKLAGELGKQEVVNILERLHAIHKVPNFADRFLAGSGFYPQVLKKFWSKLQPDKPYDEHEDQQRHDRMAAEKRR